VTRLATLVVVPPPGGQLTSPGAVHVGLWVGAILAIAVLGAAGPLAGLSWLAVHRMRRMAARTPAGIDFTEVAAHAAQFESTARVGEEMRAAVPFLAHGAALIDALRAGVADPADISRRNPW
jgi:hypothetical protein